ncbi:MAG: thermonuclease family protein, partial [Rhodospirillales bacterium]|nr:thermonuclease family protein [Rhodospirillales bacterium]
MKILIRVFIVSLSLLMVPVIAHADDLTGKPRIIDGDTIEIG